MKCFLILMLISWAYTVHAMNNDEKAATGDTVINVQDFINGKDANKYPEGEVNILDNDTKYQCNTLEDVECFLHDNRGLHEITPEYIMQYLHVEPSVLVEDYMNEHVVSDDTKNIVKKSLFDVINKMKNEDDEKYKQHVFVLFSKYSKLSSFILSPDGGKTIRRRQDNTFQQKELEDPVKPFSFNVASLNALLTEDLAKKTNESEQKARSAERREILLAIYSGIVTLVAAVVPSVLSFVGNNATSPVTGGIFNCSSIL